MSRKQAIIAALIVLVTGGLLHGLGSERWRSSAALEDAGARLHTVPKAFGDWVSKDEEDDDASFKQAGAREYWTRTYTRRGSGEMVRVILMCGRAGRMAVHTPQVCYRGAGYEMPEDAVPITIDGSSFWSAKFTKPAGAGLAAADLRLYWAWDARGPWEAAVNPRWQFRGEPFLYKLYVSHDLIGSVDGGAAHDVGAAFLSQFLPQLAEALFPPSRPVT